MSTGRGADGRIALLRDVASELAQTLVRLVKREGRAAERPLRDVAGELHDVSEYTESDAASAHGIHRDEPDPATGALGSSGSAQPDERAPLVVADELQRIHLSGAKAIWTNFRPKDMHLRKFEAWILAKTAGPLPELDEAFGCNCNEMIMWAAARRNVLTRDQLREQFAPLLSGRARRARSRGILPDNFEHNLVRTMLPHGTQRYLPDDPLGPRPERGDLIIWSGWGEQNAHTAMATGRLVGANRDPEVYSFWPPPKQPLALGTLTDAVQVTTVGELTPHIRVPQDPTFRIDFGRGPW